MRRRFGRYKVIDFLAAKISLLDKVVHVASQSHPSTNLKSQKVLPTDVYCTEEMKNSESEDH